MHRTEAMLQYGALRVDSLSAMIDAARLFLFDSVPPGSRLAVMSVSGGAGVLIADEAEALRLTVPAFTDTTLRSLTPVLPSFMRPANPLDLTGNVVQNTASISQALQAVADDPGIDAIVLFVGMMHSIASAFTDALATARKRIHRSIVVMMGAMESTVATLEAPASRCSWTFPRPCERRLAVALPFSHFHTDGNEPYRARSGTQFEHLLQSVEDTGSRTTRDVR